MNKSLLAITLALSTAILFPQLVNAADIPVINKIVIINSKKVLDSFKETDQATMLLRMNQYLKDVASANQFQIVMQDAAYANANVDITEEFISGLRTNKAVKELNFEYVKNSPAVAIVDSNKIFTQSKPADEIAKKLKTEFQSRQDALKSEAMLIKSEATNLDATASMMTQRERIKKQEDIKRQDIALMVSQKNFVDDLNLRTKELRLKLSDTTNAIINEIAKKNEISIVFQQAVYLKPDLDITPEVISALNQEKTIPQIRRDKSFGKPIKIAIVDAEKIFAEFLGESSKDLTKRTEFSNRINSQLIEFSKKNDIALVFQSAAYADSSVEVTSDLIAYIKKGK